MSVVWGHADSRLIATRLSSIQEFLISNEFGYLIHRELSVVRMAQRTKLSNQAANAELTGAASASEEEEPEYRKRMRRLLKETDPQHQSQP